MAHQEAVKRPVSKRAEIERWIASIKQVKDWLSDITPGFKGAVQVIHEDGSMFLFTHAFAITYDHDPDYLVVFTEHNGSHIFLKADLTDYTGYAPGELQAHRFGKSLRDEDDRFPKLVNKSRTKK